MDLVKTVLKWIAIAIAVLVGIVILFPNSSIAGRICAMWDRFVMRGGDELLFNGALLIVILVLVLIGINKLPGGGAAKH